MKKYLITLISLLILGLAYMISAHLYMHHVAKQLPTKEADYLIVLGAGIRGDEPSLSLKYRLDTASEYMKESPTTKVIVSGGKGNSHAYSEAEVMEKYLVSNGISAERIIQEDKATNTQENISFSKELLPDDATNIVLVSSNYHVARAKLLAERQGLAVETLASATPNSVIVQLHAREYVALVKSFFLD
ncbi:YdcF family protein [Priestia taiwanensis]|uniref:DUF218 domain-containing protein n=1 Tax=Priestia taiwanensis TaxID=1347902 RepID=A0A917ATE7_9BACI|nr:YdcF family protein [Priestia taiwanensis]MBM7364275.1 uncharacterized SAM-binding protein YcdF (DUF218 family) [Priestia taiwanensis]GGE73152.1 hypothetical protein GCM10007140_23770 [Priestia taiwanensis]